MTGPGRTFAVASDEALVGLISSARTRLLIVAPALTKPVAEAIARRFDDLERLSVTVILDSDAEVYRLGFGDQEALDTIRAASANSLFDLREQPGVRIGLLVADDTTMVYSPVSRNIEAGSTSHEKPNAVVLTGVAADCITAAAGADEDQPMTAREIGTQALDPNKVKAMQENLQANPPKPFDITRRLNVFSSKVQYVEFSVSNYRLATRQIPLPPELVDVSDEELRTRISGRIRAPVDDMDKVGIVIEHDGRSEELRVDDKWLQKERKRIEDRYTFQINNFGRLILYTDREAFDKAAERFKLIISEYQTALKKKLSESRSVFEKRVVDEYAPRWQQTPPSFFARWGIPCTPEKIEAELTRLAAELFESAVSFAPPLVKILYKNVAPENVRDTSFLEALEGIMVKRRVPREIIVSLFQTGQVAPESGRFNL